MTREMPSLRAWKSRFAALIEEARSDAGLTDADRDALIWFVRNEVERVFYAPPPQPEIADDAFGDLGYTRGMRALKPRCEQTHRRVPLFIFDRSISIEVSSQTCSAGGRIFDRPSH
jgi:hypothetical protein